MTTAVTDLAGKMIFFIGTVETLDVCDYVFCSCTIFKFELVEVENIYKKLMRFYSLRCLFIFSEHNFETFIKILLFMLQELIMMEMLKRVWHHRSDISSLPAHVT